MIEYIYEDIKSQLNRIELPQLEGVLVGDVLHYPLKELGDISKIKAKTRQYIRWILSDIKRVFTINYSYTKPEGTTSLFLFSTSYGFRRDNRRAYFEVKNLFPLGSTAVFEKYGLRCSLYKVKYLYLLFKWRRVIKKNRIGKRKIEREFIVYRLFKILCDYFDAEQYFGKGFPGINTLICWCDCHAEDSLFTQKFNLMGRNTIDLMHGSIGDIYNSWTVKGIKSKFFIADSDYTKDMLIRNGYMGKIYVCGYPYNINSCNKKKDKQDGNVCGIFLGDRPFHDDNLKLCGMSLGVRNKGYKLLCKLHPLETKKLYPLHSLESFAEIYETDITSASLFKMIDYAVMLPSTVVYEALYCNVPFLLMADEKQLYKNYGIPEEIIVHEEGEFLNKFSKMMAGDYSKTYEKLRRYYTPTGDVKENYIKAFNEIGVY